MIWRAAAEARSLTDQRNLLVGLGIVVRLGQRGAIEVVAALESRESHKSPSHIVRAGGRSLHLSSAVAQWTAARAVNVNQGDVSNVGSLRSSGWYRAARAFGLSGGPVFWRAVMRSTRGSCEGPSNDALQPTSGA